MVIRQQQPMSPEVLRDHRALIAQCRGVTCLAELNRVFDTSESNALERIIDGKKPRRNVNGEALWSRKYARYLKGTVPDLSTVRLAERAAVAIGRPTRISYWRDTPLWVLLAEPALKLEQLGPIMAGLPRVVRAELYHLSALDPYGRQLRKEFTRNGTIRMRDIGSIDAFVGLLALAREGEILEDDPRHVLAVRCAFEMLPIVLRNNPPLYRTWPDLFELLNVAFCGRVYHGGVILPDYTLANVERGIEALGGQDSTSPVEQEDSQPCVIRED